MFIGCQERRSNLTRKMCVTPSLVVFSSLYNKAQSFSHAAIINNLLTGEGVDVSSPSDARLNCTFLPGFTGSAHCTVQCGTWTQPT